MVMRMLLLINLLLGIGLGSMWLDESGQPRVFSWQAPQPLSPELNTVAILSPVSVNPAQYLSILDRPLFAPDRLPPPPPETVASSPPPTPDPFAMFHLLGTFAGAGSTGVLASVEGKVRRLYLSDNLGEWTLKSIDDRDIAFSRGDETRVIRLLHAKLGAAKPPVAVSAATAPQSAMSEVHDVQTEMQRRQEYVRENIRKRNEIRIKAGLPPVND